MATPGPPSWSLTHCRAGCGQGRARSLQRGRAVQMRRPRRRMSASPACGARSGSPLRPATPGWPGRQRSDAAGTRLLCSTVPCTAHIALVKQMLILSNASRPGKTAGGALISNRTLQDQILSASLWDSTLLRLGLPGCGFRVAWLRLGLWYWL